MKKSRLYIVISFFSCGFLMILFKVLGNDDASFLFVILMFASVITLFVYTKNENKEVAENYIKETNSYIYSNNINVSKSIFSDTMTSRIILDHDNEKMHILKYKSPPVIISYSKIVESELIENGNTLTKTSRGSQLAGVAIGGALAGGVGAVIGGLSANSTSSNEIKKLELKIVVDDLNSPVSSFYVKDSINGYEKGSVLYDKLYDSAYELHKIISLIIKNNK